MLSLDLPAARKVIAHLVLNPEATPSPAALAALDDVLVAWHRAGVAC
ncbi:hypothetical protein [Embleya sp. NBC_00896]|nr:hypothetical protein OG928_33400 [Embleya sp. NBC_00896]